MLTHNPPAVNCFKYFTAKSTLVSILLHYFLLCCSHDCNVDAHAKNIPTLVVVLCPILCQRKLLTQQLTTKFLLLSTHSSGAPRGYLCVHMYTDWLYRCLVVSLGLDQCTQAVQYIPRPTYRRLPTNQGPAGGYSSDQSEAEKIRHSDTHIGSLYIDKCIASLFGVGQVGRLSDAFRRTKRTRQARFS